MHGTQSPHDLRGTLFSADLTTEDLRDWFLDFAALLWNGRETGRIRTWRDVATQTARSFDHLDAVTPESVAYTLELAGLELDVDLPPSEEMEARRLGGHG